MADDIPSAAESAVIVRIPAAEPVAGAFRADLDRSAAEGIPAHVTVISPFVAPARIDEHLLGALADVAGSVPAFEVTFARCSWFGDAVLWLAPEPAAPFRALTAALWSRFPDCPPYGGAYDDVVPHLTVGHSVESGRLRPAARALSRRLPFTARAESVTLMARAGGLDRWRVVAELPLRTSGRR
jgi:hypothetical protein